MKYCYLCGEKLIKNQNKSKDHVPPDCIFPSNKPLNLITIPCCKSCNEGFKSLDQKMRNFFAILAGDKSGEVGKIAKNEVLRSRKLRSDFLSHTKELTTVVHDSKPMLAFYFNDEELERWLVRVVKGLSFRRNSSRISDCATYSIKKFPELTPQSSTTFPMEKGLEFRPYFVYGVIQERDSDFWVLIFYDHLMFGITVKT